MKWQPIETAPSETIIYVWLPGYSGRGDVVRTKWTGRSAPNSHQGFWWNDMLNGGVSNSDSFRPRFWMLIETPE